MAASIGTAMRRYVEHRSFAESFAVWLGIGLGIAALVGCAFAYLMVRPAHGAETYRVPVACAALAQRRGITNRIEREEALQLIKELDANMKWPGVRICREAVRRELKL